MYGPSEEEKKKKTSKEILNKGVDQALNEAQRTHSDGHFYQK